MNRPKSAAVRDIDIGKGDIDPPLMHTCTLYKKLSCHIETTRCFVALNISLSHSSHTFDVTVNDTHHHHHHHHHHHTRDTRGIHVEFCISIPLQYIITYNKLILYVNKLTAINHAFPRKPCENVNISDVITVISVSKQGNCAAQQAK